MLRILFLLGLLPCGLLGQTFHTVGYLPHYRFELKDQLAFEDLTLLNLSFLNPDSLGNWSIGGKDIQPVLQRARQVNPDLQICISIAGGALTPEWAAAYQQFMQPEQRSGFIHSLMNYLRQYQLDGVDVDLEWSHVDELYSPFVLELSDSIHAEGLLLTAALPGTYRYPDISHAALAKYDYVHMMAYDLRGPWNANDIGPHSPVSFAQQSINHWIQEGVPAQKLTLGVPFYGYDFSQPSNITAFTFHSIVAEDTSLAYVDQAGQRYYNGIPTIRVKTQMAFQQVAGIMIWEIGQDAHSNLAHYSLLQTIASELQVLNSVADNLIGQVHAYPNPMAQVLTLERQEPGELLHISLHSLNGSVLQERAFPAFQQQVQLPTDALAPGVYLLQLRGKNGASVKKLMKY